MKRIIIIAGPNGAGKTTFAKEYLPREADCITFINADLIAQGLSPFQPEKVAVKAGKLMLEIVNDFVEKGESFSFETTLSGKSYAKMIQAWRKIGYHVSLIYLTLPNVGMAKQRVAERVIHGGHNIPEQTIERRFENGLNLFHTLYKALVDDWQIYDNSDVIPKLTELK